MELVDPVQSEETVCAVPWEAGSSTVCSEKGTRLIIAWVYGKWKSSGRPSREIGKTTR